MAVIPRSPILLSFKCIGEALVWRNSTLSDSVYPVHFWSIKLPHSMPVNACPILFEIIVDGNLYCVAPASMNLGSWIRLVEDLAIMHLHTIKV